MRSGNKNSAAVAKTLRFTWSYRVELLLVLFFLSIFWLAKSVPIYLSIGFILAVVTGLSLPVQGHWFYGAEALGKTLKRNVDSSAIRRQVVIAAADSGFPGLKVEKVAATLPGEMISVRVPRGATIEKLENSARAMAGCLRVSDVRVLHDRSDRSRADLSIIRRDVFESTDALPWPLLNAELVNIRNGIPFGRDEYGRVIDVRLLSRNIMLGGAPDAGKSAALRLLAAGAALDPKVKLWMMDAKTGGAEFVHWAPAAADLVRGRDVIAAAEMLAKLEERIEQRGQEIVARGEVFVQDDMELDVLMIDELPQFLRVRDSDSKAEEAAVKAIRNHIWKLIAVGRWAGMITALSAQKPTADIVPSESRDLIDIKFALHCNTRAMSKAITGDGADDDSGVDACDIPSGQPGVGYFIGDGKPQKIRTFFLSHKESLEIASRVSGQQLDVELRSMS